MATLRFALYRVALLARMSIALVLLVSGAEASAPKPPCSPDNASNVKQLFSTWPLDTHPLLAQVWEGGRLGPTDPAHRSDPCAVTEVNHLLLALSEAIRSGGIVLLGEVHDNAEHHKLRALLISMAGVAELGRRPAAVVMEHIRADQGPMLEAYRASGTMSAEGLGPAIGWDQSGWPSWQIFRPLADAALAAKMPVLPGDPRRERIRALARGDRSGLSEAELALIKIGEDMPQPLTDSLNEELVESHCGVMPASAFGNMSIAQRFRDAHQARALVDAAEANGSAFLLAGNGHVRTDRAVPWYVRRMAPGRKVVSVMLLEVTAGENDAASYLMRDPDGKVAADYVLFTPRTERPDPCQKLREQFSKKK